MNRMKKEELKTQAALLKGLNPKQIETLELAQIAIKSIQKLQSHIHNQLFPEETDFMADSIDEAKDRDRGINPMSQAYQEKVNKRRAAMGIKALDKNGMCHSNDSRAFSKNITQELLNTGDLKAHILNHKSHE